MLNGKKNRVFYIDNIPIYRSHPCAEAILVFSESFQLPVKKTITTKEDPDDYLSGTLFLILTYKTKQ
jgi:hypothetical protein